MRGGIALWSAIVLVIVSPAVRAEMKSVVLKNGDLLLGNVLDETETEISIRLKNGILLRLSKKDIESLEEPKASETEPVPSEKPESDDVDLGALFQEPNPTPTPLPIVPLDLKLNFKKNESKDPSTLRSLPAILANIPGTEAEAATDEVREETRSFGRVVWTEGICKFRHFESSWQPILTGTALWRDDEVNTLAGLLVARAEANAVICLHPDTLVRFSAKGFQVDQGKGWAKIEGEKPFSVRIAAVEAVSQNAVLNVEILRSGLRIVVLEGETILYKQPEGEIIRGDIRGPISFLLDANREIVSQSPPNESGLKEWKAWEARIPPPQASAQQIVASTEEAGELALSLQMDDFQRLQSAVQAFYADLGRFPRAESPFFQELVEDPGDMNWKGPYLEQTTLPLVDRWGSELDYRVHTDPNGSGPVVEILSIGPDKKPQKGEGDDLAVMVTPPKK